MASGIGGSARLTGQRSWAAAGLSILTVGHLFHFTGHVVSFLVLPDSMLMGSGACFGDAVAQRPDANRQVQRGRTIKSSNSTIEFARCFLRLANLPNFALDRLSRYEATLWHQVGRILFALDALDRRKPQERRRRCR
jgi:hypothetical protein